MYDIDIYSYKDQPETNSGKYNAYPLNDQGVHKYYLQKESHATTYLNYLNPIIYNHIVGQDKKKLTAKDSNGKEKNEIPLQNEINKENINEKNNLNEIIDNSDNIVKHQANNYQKNLVNSNAVNQFQKIKPMRTKTTRPNYQNFESTNVFFERLRRTRSCDNIYDNESSTKEKKLKLNKYFKQFHRKIGFKDIFGYPRPLNCTTRGDIYNNEISSLNDEMDSTLDQQSQSQFRKTKNNFDIRKIPRTDSFINNKKYSNYFTCFTKKINQSININHSNLLEKGENKVIVNKISELKKKISEQINQKFLEKMKLPDIRKIANCNKVISRIKFGIHKNLGEKYNPFALVLNQTTTKGRNYTGGIFQY